MASESAQSTCRDYLDPSLQTQGALQHTHVYMGHPGQCHWAHQLTKLTKGCPPTLLSPHRSCSAFTAPKDTRMSMGAGPQVCSLGTTSFPACPFRLSVPHGLLQAGVCGHTRYTVTATQSLTPKDSRRTQEGAEVECLGPSSEAELLTLILARAGSHSCSSARH